MKCKNCEKLKKENKKLKARWNKMFKFDLPKKVKEEFDKLTKLKKGESK